MKGKLSYMAPEQVQSSTYDQRIDVYALGVVLFEMLSNRLPYAGSSEPTVLRRLIDNDPEPQRRAAGLPCAARPHQSTAATHPEPAAAHAVGRARCTRALCRCATRARPRRALRARRRCDAQPRASHEAKTAVDRSRELLQELEDRLVVRLIGGMWCDGGGGFCLSDDGPCRRR